MNHDALIKKIAPVTDREASGKVSPLTRHEMAEHIMSAAPLKATPRRRRAWFVAVPLAAAAAVVIAISVGSSGSPAPKVYDGPAAFLAALSFSSPEGGYITVRIKDPSADPALYRKEFAAHGMNVDLRLVPVSPSLVGSVVMDGPVEMKIGPGGKKVIEKPKDDRRVILITASHCAPTEGDGSCPVGVKIPVGYKDQYMVVFGRSARPGERYASTASAGASGEVMHGLNFKNRTVSEVLAMLRKRHITVPQYRYEGSNTAVQPYPNGLRPDQVKPGWYVHDAVPWAAGQVMLFVGPKPTDR
jgi:hypothetical protein